MEESGQRELEPAANQEQTPLILTIDDERPIRESFRFYLEDCGFRVIEAEDGVVGMEQFYARKPDLVLLDLRMANRDGIDVLAELSERSPATPVIVISGTGVIEDVVNALRLGAWDYLLKPIKDLSILRHAVDKCLETAQLRAANQRYQKMLEQLVAERTEKLEMRNRELMQTLQALKRSETNREQLFHEFEGIFNGIPDAITLWSAQGVLIWGNEATRDLYQQPVEELVGRACRDICALCNPPEHDCEVRRSLQSGATEVALRQAPDGRQWGIKAFPLRDAGGHIIRVVRLASDVTERARLREEAARASHLAALGEISAGVAHEINNPTGLILLQMPIVRELLLTMRPLLDEHFRLHGDFSAGGVRYSVLRDELAPMVDGIVESAQRIRHIVEELKDFSRPSDPEQFEAVDLNEVVRKGLALLSGQLRKATGRFSVQYDETLPPVRGNFRRLEQVVINLVQNACQALESSDAEIAVGLSGIEDNSRCVLRISDEGRGIPPELLAHITDPFFTTRREEGGTGLGLSVSARIIQQHGGTLQFSSEVGQGTVVRIELPVFNGKENP